MRELTEEKFLKEVADHKMYVLMDSGVYRHIKFARQGEHAWYNWFTLTTWPGHLCISGDMGTFVFNRLEDMFEFFRSPKPDKLYVNLGYWAEKCDSEDRRTDGVMIYDEDVFRSVVGERFNNHEWASKTDKKECWQQIKDEVLCAENEYEAYRFAGNFKFEGEVDKFEFYDFWESRLRRYSYHYEWCCYAIAWGIRQYDAATEQPASVGMGPNEGLSSQ